MLAASSGTKAFVSTFSSALAEEVRQHNIVAHNINTNTYFVICSLYFAAPIAYPNESHAGLKNVGLHPDVAICLFCESLRPIDIA